MSKEFAVLGDDPNIEIGQEIGQRSVFFWRANRVRASRITTLMTTPEDQFRHYEAWNGDGHPSAQGLPVGTLKSVEKQAGLNLRR